MTLRERVLETYRRAAQVAAEYDCVVVSFTLIAKRCGCSVSAVHYIIRGRKPRRKA